MALPSPAQGVWFPQWAEVLARARLKDQERRAFRRAIFEYLAFCKQARQRATVASARHFMERVEAKRCLGRSQLATWKLALNWFFKAAQSPTAEPGTAQLATPCSRDKEPPGVSSGRFRAGGNARIPGRVRRVYPASESACSQKERSFVRASFAESRF